MESDPIYIDPRFQSELTRHFLILYWLVPILCLLGIPVVVYALMYQIPAEFQLYGATGKLKGIVLLMGISILLGIHVLVGTVGQAILDFPLLIASISMSEDGNFIVKPFVGDIRSYKSNVRIELKMEQCRDPFWLRIYRFSTYKHRFRCKVSFGEDEWLVSKPALEAQDSLERLQSFRQI